MKKYITKPICAISQLAICSSKKAPPALTKPGLAGLLSCWYIPLLDYLKRAPPAVGLSGLVCDYDYDNEPLLLLLHMSHMKHKQHPTMKLGSRHQCLLAGLALPTLNPY